MKFGKENEEESFGESLHNIQVSHFNIEQERVYLKNFQRALMRRLQKKAWTRAEKIDFLARKIYVIGLNILLIPQVIQFGDQYDWLPQDNLFWKILLYFNGLIALTAYNDYVMEALKKEFLSEYSREEQVLYSERHSVSRELPKKVYIPLFLVGFATPIIAAIYEGFRNKHLYGKITDVPWLDNFLTFLPTTPLYLGFTVSGVQMFVLLLTSLKPLKDWGLRAWNRETAISQARKLPIKLIRKSLLQKLRKALENYRNDTQRCVNYKDIFSKLSALENDLQDPESGELLDLLISTIEISNINSVYSSQISNQSNNSISFKSLILPAITIAQLIGFLFFNQIQEPNFFRESFLFLSFNIDPNVSFSVYSIPAGVLVFALYTMVNSALFKKTTSLLLNKLSSFVRFLLNREHNVPIAIQRHHYLYMLSSSVVTTSVILSLPFITLQIFFNWLFGGYDNEHHFDEVQYTGKNAFVYFYLPAILTFGYMAAQLWRSMTSVFKYAVNYFSNKPVQRQELQLEKLLKITILMLDSCKPDSSRQIIGDISNLQFLQLGIFDPNDPEKLLREAYRLRGIMSLAEDPLYIKYRNEILNNRRKNEAEDPETEIIEGNLEEEDKIKEGTSTEKTSDILTIKESVRLMIRLDAHIFNKPKNETDPLLEASDKNSSFLSKKWCQEARCNLF